MNALEILVLDVAYTSYVWHLLKNVFANCRKYFRNDEDWAGLFIHWTNVIQSVIFKFMKRNLAKCGKDFSGLQGM